MLKKKIFNIILKNSNSYNFYKAKYEESLEKDKIYNKTLKLLKEENSLFKQEIKSNKELDNEIELLINENKSLNKKIETFNQQIKDETKQIQNQNNKLHDEIKTLKQEKISLENELTNLKNTNQQLLKIINENSEKLLLIQKQLDYNIIKINSKTNQIERLNQKLSEINHYMMTIIIPVYNSSDYIEKCFLSILKQSIFNKIEVIFVDDCSTDNSLEILYNFRENYDNVRVFQTDKNTGFGGKPRNIGIKYATADYLLFLDSDDTLCDNACQILLDKIISTSADIVSGLHREYHGPHKKMATKKQILLRTLTDKSKNLDQRFKQLDKLLQDYPNELIIENIREYPYILNSYSLTSKIFNKKFIQDNNILFTEDIPSEDSYFIFKSFSYSKKTVFIYDVIYIYNKYNYNSEYYVFNQKSCLGRLKSYNMMYELSQKMDISQIFVEVMLGEKIDYLISYRVLNSDMSDEEYIEIFKKGKNLFNILLENNIILTRKFNDLFTKIIEEDYAEAINICKTLKSI